MKLWEWFLDLLFPQKCPFCQKILEDPRSPLCPDCQGKLPWLSGAEACRQVEGTAGCLSPLAYRDGVPEAVRRYKFPGNPSYGRPFGLLMAQCAGDNLKEPVDLVTWVPLSQRRRRKRGFDQARLLAETVAGELKLPARPLLEKVRDNGPQSRLEDDGERRANVKGAYRLRPGEELSGLRILLVDDVVTTGSTLGECARTLDAGGAAKVWALTLAQARKNSMTEGWQKKGNTAK